MPQAFNIEGAPLELLDVGELALARRNFSLSRISRCDVTEIGGT